MVRIPCLHRHAWGSVPDQGTRIPQAVLYTSKQRKYTPKKNGFTTLARMILPPLSGQPWSRYYLGCLVAVVILLGPCLFNLFIKLLSSRLQQFQVRLMMSQRIQPIPVEGIPGPQRSLEQSAKELYVSRVDEGLWPLSNRKKFQKRPSAS